MTVKDTPWAHCVSSVSPNIGNWSLIWGNLSIEVSIVNGEAPFIGGWLTYQPNWGTERGDCGLNDSSFKHIFSDRVYAFSALFKSILGNVYYLDQGRRSHEPPFVTRVPPGRPRIWACSMWHGIVSLHPLL